MEYDFLIFISIILLSTKALSLLSQKVHMPAVVGSLVAGVILGPSVLNLVGETGFLTETAEIGVILLMFLAGLDTDLEELKKNGVASFIIAFIGVIVPLIGGFLIYSLFFGFDINNSDTVLRAVFVGVVLTATSVSITVETLREMGKLKGKLGTTILGAAIIDDIIGIIVLTIITSLRDTSINPITIVIKVCIYFIFIICLNFIVRLMKKVIEKYDHRRRVVITSLAFCFILSYISERFFGIADITGAYFAGIMLCTFHVRNYINARINTISYLFFGPIFFANIGIKISLDGLTGSFILFAVFLLLVAIFSKILGCGLGAKLCGFSFKESLAVGVGMVSRGEVALIVAQKGFEVGLLNKELFPPIVFMVIVTTLITPILLKFVIKNTSESGLKQSQ